MATLKDVRTICGDLPETEERTSRGRAMWHVGRGHAFVWERPYTKADVGREGEPPPGDLLAVAVADEGEKKALIRAEPDWFFTISHFDGHPMLLLRLDAVPDDRLREIVVESWYTNAPADIAAAHPDLA